jgi:hypothetical protein
MNTNKNLETIEKLHMAAYAAGYRVLREKQAEREAEGRGHVGLWTEVSTCWNPLTSFGDAYDLAMRLKFTIRHVDSTVQVWESERDSEALAAVHVGWREEVSQAGAIAIFEAAAKIGRDRWLAESRVIGE